VLTKDAPEDEDEFGSDEFGLFGLGKKNREKRLQRRHARVADKLEATEEGTKKHERLQRRLERIEAKMDKHDIEYGLYDDYAYGGDWDEDDGQVDLEEVYDQFGFLPLLFSPLTYVAAGAVRAAGAKDRRASRKTGKRALWGRYHREIQRAMKAGNHSKASRIRGKQESLEKKMGASEVEKAREEAERYSFGARFSPRQPVRRMEVVNEDEFFGLEDVPLFG